MSDDPIADRRRHNARLAAVDAELAEEWRQRQTATPEAVTGPPLPFVVDCGQATTRADREAIQREEDRWTRLERLGR